MTESRDTSAQTESTSQSPSGGRLWAILTARIHPARAVIGLVRGRIELWTDTIEGAALPREVAGVVHEIVRRTRLWNRERIEVARELCNHAADALASGVDAGGVASGMGDPRVVARLIRRSMRRKRHWLWHARVWCVRSIVGAVALFVVISGAMAARLYLGQPTVRRSFIAELNEPIERTSPDERSYPLIKEAWLSFGRELALAERITKERGDEYVRRHQDADPPKAFDDSQWDKDGLSLVPFIEPDHPDYATAMSLLERVQPELAMFREAAFRPVLGRPFAAEYTQPPVDPDTGQTDWVSWRGWIGDPLPLSEDPADQPIAIYVLLQDLGPIRQMCKWLAFDAIVRADRGDGAGAAESLEAMTAMATQLDTDSFFIGALVGIAIDAIQFQALGALLRDNPGLFTSEQLVAMAHRIGTQRFERVPLEGEEMMFEDFLQRSFTDDGNGNGRLTDEGLRLLFELDGLGNNERVDLFDGAEIAWIISRIASRREQALMHGHAFAQLRKEEEAGYRVYRENLSHADTLVETMDPYKYYPLRILLPALSSAMARFNEHRAASEACLTGIACELYRREHGAWPAAIEDLVPRFMPFVPEDPFTGDALRVAFTESHAIVYGVGPDGDDDGGTLKGEDFRSLRPRLGGRYDRYWDPATRSDREGPVDGDWVLFPLQSEK